MTLMKMTPDGAVPMSADEERTVLAERTAAAQASQATALRTQALAALEANDRVAVRCKKAGIAYPAPWLAYDQALRAIVQAGTGTIPDRPEYPSGT